VLDGEPGPWLPPGFEIMPQCDGPLDERLAAAFAAVRGPALLIGMDTPQVTPGLLAVDWRAADAVFGPAADGGFWALGLRVTELPQLRDVDTAADAVAVARQAPQSQFAARARELAVVLSPVRTGKGALGASALGGTA
jgi:glycosyltransferase A (GT-A) superfamily protein (DUF2064 family)